MNDPRRAVLAAAAAVGCAAAPACASSSAYDQAILADRPVLYLAMDSAATGSEPDLSGHGHSAAYAGGAPADAALPNGDTAADFDGDGQYLSVAPSRALSVPTTKALTIESWIRPDVLDFSRVDGEGYVYWLGKGDAGRGYEYANRMYSLNNSAGRPNRISVYAWNKRGGLGSGSYFQDPTTPGRWIMVTDVVDMKTGTIAIYKDGALRGRVPLSQYRVKPRSGDAPLNVGTRDGRSFFAGAVGKVAVYDRVLDDATIAAHFRAMAAPADAAQAP